MACFSLDLALRSYASRILQLALKEHDNKQIYMARQHLLDIRNIYAVLADLIQKNIAKVCCLIFWQLLLTDGCVAASSEEQ
jgi:hypothetical protein